jgi:DNA processing protein
MSAVCGECAARGLLLAGLAGHISTAVDRGASRRARDLLALSDEELAAAVTGSRAAADEALGHSRNHASIRALGRRLEASGCWMLCRHDAHWPGALERLGPAEPRALYGRGDPLLPAAPDAITIVGARRAGAYGREVAEGLGYGLGAAGAVTVSGLALGIDSAAHQGTIRAGAAGLAVLAAAPERAYPRSAAGIYRELIGTSGAVVSELPPGSAVRRWMFPARNRIMAALGEITVVVEAAERSGSLITVEMAIDCSRTVAAVPGPVNSWRSSGTNLLLVEGAVPVRGAADVLEQLHGPGAGLAASAPSGPALAQEEAEVLDAVERGSRNADAVAGELGIGAAACAASLARLELAGYVEADFTGSYSRTLLERPGEGPRRA